MSASLQLPTYLATAWDRWRNPTAWTGVREALGRNLEAAIGHEHDADRRAVLQQLHRVFMKAGGTPTTALCAVLPFPRRQPPSRQPAAKVVRLPLKSADVELVEAAE